MADLFGKIKKTGGFLRGRSRMNTTDETPNMGSQKGSDLQRFFGRSNSLKPKDLASRTSDLLVVPPSLPKVIIYEAPRQPSDLSSSSSLLTAATTTTPLDTSGGVLETHHEEEESRAAALSLNTRNLTAFSLVAQEKNELPTRAPGQSMMGINRYWHLNCVLEDKNVFLSWRLRMLIALDVARQLKKLNEKEVSCRLLVSNLVVDQNSTCRVESHSAMKKSSQYSQDVFFFGCVLVQLALANTLVLSTEEIDHPIPPEAYKELKKLFVAECNQEAEALADSLEFAELLSTEVRALSGITRPKPSENVPEDAISSMEELCVQCCSAMSMNRPEADAIEDWLLAIVEMVGGVQLTSADKEEREQVLWALQTSENELFDDITWADESDVFTGKITRVDEGGYDTDDSYQPPTAAAAAAAKEEEPQQRRASRLSMFLVVEENASPSNRPSTNEEHRGVQQNGETLEEATKRKKKLMNSRMSIKPQAVERFAHANRKQETSRVLTPEQCRSKFDKQERLTSEEVASILGEAERIFKLEPNVPTMQAPATVVGDIHGQYFDLANMIDLNGTPSSTNKYLFLGDYVDRGDWSCEVFFYILSMKIAFPQHVVMIRGNHECDAVSSYFGFKVECESKYGRPVFYKCISLFQSLPVGAILDTGGAGRFLCVHGGISPHVSSLEQIDQLDRFKEPGMNGIMCDVLWSDPIKDDFDDGQHGKSLSDFLSIDFVSNPARGCSFRYGYTAIMKFLASNRLVAVIRAHEVMQEGFRYHFQTVMGGNKAQARIMPPVITVFSAPNYLGTYGNRGAILRVKSAKDRATTGFKPIDLLDPYQFDAVTPPTPLLLANETALQTGTIEKSCPYMPTTFDSFVARAIEFANGELDVLEEANTVGEIEEEEEELTIFDLDRKKSSVGVEMLLNTDLTKANELRNGLAQTVAMQTVDIFKLLPTNINTRRQSLVMLREKKGVSNLIAKFSSAAAADGINEMHPSLVQEKMNQAASKVLDAPSTAATTTNTASTASNASSSTNVRQTTTKKPMMTTSTSSAGRTSVVSKRTSVVNNRTSVRKPSKLLQKKPSAEVTTEVDFDEEEIVALQMLYLIIDRKGMGLINSQDLFQWCAADGTTIGMEDASQCVNALDMDEDGSIGFNDYLAFAGIMKLKFQKKQNRLL